MASKKSGKVEAVGSRNDGEFGILLDDDNWYNGNGDKPPLNEGDEVELEFELDMNNGDEERWLVDDEDSIQVTSAAASSSSSGSGTAGTKDDRAVSRQSAAKTVARMFQGSPPEDAEDMLRRYKFIDQIAEFNIRGEWPDSVSNGQMVFEADIPDDVEDQMQELSDRIGQIEQAGGPEAASSEQVDELKDEVDSLEKQVENLQAALQELKDEDQETLFDGEKDDEEGGEEDDE